MADSFLNSELTENGYTKMVTAEDLNNIAVDLGLPDYSYFTENSPQYAVEALNQITKDLVHPGVLFVYDRCNVTVDDGKITVATGVCVFNTGAKKRVTEPITLDLVTGSVNYIYMQNNIAENKIVLISSTESPEDGLDIVMLAQISSEGVVTDKRTFAQQKMDYTENKYVETYDVFDDGTKVNIIHIPQYTSGATEYKIYAGTNNYRFLLMKKLNYYYGNNGSEAEYLANLKENLMTTPYTIGVEIPDGSERTVIYDDDNNIIFTRKGEEIAFSFYKTDGRMSQQIVAGFAFA